jgi:hypothetical protein
MAAGSGRLTLTIKRVEEWRELEGWVPRVFVDKELEPESWPSNFKCNTVELCSNRCSCLAV